MTEMSGVLFWNTRGPLIPGEVIVWKNFFANLVVGSGRNSRREKTTVNIAAPAPPWKNKTLGLQLLEENVLHANLVACWCSFLQGCYVPGCNFSDGILSMLGRKGRMTRGSAEMSVLNTTRVSHPRQLVWEVWRPWQLPVANMGAKPQDFEIIEPFVSCLAPGWGDFCVCVNEMKLKRKRWYVAFHLS